MLNHKIEAATIKKAIEKSRRIVLVSHKNPDGDTIGSVCAWIHFLKAKGKEVTAFCRDRIPSQFAYLPGSHLFTSDPAVFKRPPDIVMVNDAGSLDYAGIEDLAQELKDVTLINIDHHATNTYFGHINVVISGASSNTEVVTRLLLHWGEEITKPMAVSLLNGLVTDTDHLTNPATNYRSMEIAATLIRAGADMPAIAASVLKNKSLTDLKLWGRVFSRLKKNKIYNIVTTYISNEDLREFGATEDAVSGISNYLSLMHDANVVMFLRIREDEVIKASMRTTRDSIDVSLFAERYFGGGGHKKASGFQIQGTLRVHENGWTIV